MYGKILRMEMTLQPVVETRVLHSGSIALAKCRNGHSWNATAANIAVGQVSVCGQGVTERKELTVVPGTCPHCARTWQAVYPAAA